MYYEFIELAPFAAVRDELFGDEQFLELQWYLCRRPEAGDVIPETGGCRKLRWKIQGKGKRGGARVIYFLRTEAGQIVLVDPSGEMLRPARKTELLPQPDGSLIRRITDKMGNVTEDTISAEQRLSLDARTQLKMSQQQFAAMLGISVRTLHDWEQGRREPSGAARTLLKIAASHPEVVRKAIQSV